MKKLKLCVSACLIGFKYRYDGKNALSPEIIGKFQDIADFIPVCPEVECGLAIPREPMRLVLTPRGTRLTVISSGEDMTDRFLQWAYGKLEQLAVREPDGFIFHSKSPSCGLGSTKLYDTAGHLISETGTGLFAALFRRKFPGLPLAQETDLEALLENFRILRGDACRCEGDCCHGHTHH